MESLSCFMRAASETFCAASCDCCGYGVLDAAGCDATDGDEHGACMTDPAMPAAGVAADAAVEGLVAIDAATAQCPVNKRQLQQLQHALFSSTTVNNTHAQYHPRHHHFLRHYYNVYITRSLQKHNNTWWG